jgi:hypothetical protein
MSPSVWLLSTVWMTPPPLFDATCEVEAVVVAAGVALVLA